MEKRESSFWTSASVRLTVKNAAESATRNVESAPRRGLAEGGWRWKNLRWWWRGWTTLRNEALSSGTGEGKGEGELHAYGSLWSSRPSICGGMQLENCEAGFGYRKLWMLCKTILWCASVWRLSHRCGVCDWNWVCFSTAWHLGKPLYGNSYPPGSFCSLPLPPMKDVYLGTKHLLSENNCICCFCERSAALYWPNTQHQAVPLSHSSRTTSRHACAHLLVSRRVRGDNWWCNCLKFERMFPFVFNVRRVLSHRASRPWNSYHGPFNESYTVFWHGIVLTNRSWVVGCFINSKACINGLRQKMSSTTTESI